ncbi:hypothetical protein [Bacillus sp. AFS040349]|uniref:hypothetical protein n=1 Tax=Bacillus sp. AFS040349 TaxID=2033502 RepID=UPI000BFE2C39|nr:hypothetical protein [Bacillus sp. AFS040349]PGT83232.1 hypothetical protein COD11_12925 [Bacillus sp. AFS040349]
MVDAISKTVAFLLAIVLLFLVPLSFNFEREDELASLTAQNAVTKFVDSVRNKGYISPTMYNQFTQELQKIGYTYDIEITHEKKTYFPVYTDPSDPNSFTGEYMTDYQNYYSAQILPILFPDNTLPIDDDSRLYKLTTGDFFKVEVKNTNRTNSTILRDFLTGGNTGNPVVIHIPYGGMVHNEDY